MFQKICIFSKLKTRTRYLSKKTWSFKTSPWTANFDEPIEMCQPCSWAVTFFASTYLIQPHTHIQHTQHTHTPRPRRRIQSLLLFLPHVLQFLGEILQVFVFPHLNCASVNCKRMRRRFTALASSGTEVDCRRIIGDFNMRWFLTWQLL